MSLKAFIKHYTIQSVVFRTSFRRDFMSSSRCVLKRTASLTSLQKPAYPEQFHHGWFFKMTSLQNTHAQFFIYRYYFAVMLSKQCSKTYSTSAQKSPCPEEEAVKDVVHHLAKFTSDFSSVENEVTDLVSFLIQRKVNPEQIKYLLSSQTKLLIKPVDIWSKAFTTLKDLGFHSDQLLPAVVKIPTVIEGKLQKLLLTMDTLRAIGFREKQISMMILSHPALLNQPSKKLIQQYSKLLQLFTKTGVVHTLLRTPALFTEPMDLIKNKLLYVQDVMRVDKESMTKSRFLRYDLLHLYSRHQFLLRAGRYSTPNKHGETRFPNPSLKDIMDTSDRYFALKVAQLTLDEYRTFVEMCTMEMKYGKGVESLDDDSFSDEADDDYDDVNEK